MKREDVKNKIPGITEEQLNWLMHENGADINREKSAATALQTQLNNVNAPLKTAQEGLAKFDGVDVAALNAQVAKLQADLKTQADGFAFDNALDTAILGKKGHIARQQPRGSGDSGSMGLFLHLLVDQNAEFLHHVLQRTANTLHFRDIHNTRGLYALDVLLHLGKCCTDLRTFFLGNIHDNHHFILKWVAKWVRSNEKHPETYVSRCYFLVGAGGFEPPKLKAADLQSVPIGHSGTRPYSFVSAVRTACIYYHAQSSLSTICNRFYRNFCTNLSNKLAPWKNRPEINVPERFFLELVTGVEPATH